MPEMELPDVTSASDEWVACCRSAAYRFYLAAANRRFDDVEKIAGEVCFTWGEITGNWTRATLPFAYLAQLGLEERLVAMCEDLGIFKLIDLDREPDETFLAIPNVAEKIVENLRAFSAAAWLAVDEARRE